MSKLNSIGYLEDPSGRRLLQESHSVGHGNRYCVPNALSAVTGLMTLKWVYSNAYRKTIWWMLTIG